MQHRKKHAVISQGILAFALSALFFVLPFAGCGGNGGSSEVERLIAAAGKANDEVTSYRMALSMSFAGEDLGSVKTEELVIGVSGDDISLQDTLFDPATGEGTIIQEVVRVGDRQWRMEPGGGGWVEEEPNLDREVIASYKPLISDVLANSSSAVVLGEEEVNGVTATHLRFELSPENVSALLPDIPQTSLEGNTGGRVDLWLDAVDDHAVRYEMVFHDVVIQQGYESVDVHVVLDISDINQPIEISPPV